MIEFPKDIISNRKNLAFLLARTINILGYQFLGKSYAEIPEKLASLRQENAVFLFAGLHKSLWETTGVLVALYKNKIEIPYAGMGDNLVKGKFFQKLAKQVGVFLIKRPTNRREILESAKQLKVYLITILSQGKNVLFFPEGTRKSIIDTGEYGKFFPTAFEAVLEYERDKEEILQHYPELKSLNIYIVPTNVDYSRVREGREMLETFKGKPRTLKVHDSLSMLQRIGKNYVSFGEPIKVADHLSMDRKELSVITRRRCLELVKILPINVVSRAVLDSIENGQIQQDMILPNIRRNVGKLIHLKDRFRDFSIDDSPDRILKKVTRYEKVFRPDFIDIQHQAFYKMYADYIGHYFSDC